MFRTMERPRPVPCPAGLVVKKGSKILPRSSSLMPTPLSEMAKPTVAPPAAQVRTRTVPPRGLDRVGGVGDQVDRHLQDLIAHRLDAGQVAGVVAFQRGVGALQHVLAERQRLIQHLVDGDLLHLAARGAGVADQVAGEAPDALGALLDLAQAIQIGGVEAGWHPCRPAPGWPCGRRWRRTPGSR